MEELWNSIVAWGKDNLADWTMVKVYLAFAIAGGSLLLGQLGLSVFGLGDGDDVDPDVDVDAQAAATTCDQNWSPSTSPSTLWPDLATLRSDPQGFQKRTRMEQNYPQKGRLID